MPLYELNGKAPSVHSNVTYLSDSAIIIGDVSIGEGCSIFDNVVIEGDEGRVVIGKRVNIQSQSIIHTLRDFHTFIGDRVTIGHRAVIHGARIETNALIGIGCIVSSYATVGRAALVGEGSVVAQRMQIPAHCLALGVPARIVKTLSPADEEQAVRIADAYVHLGLTRARTLRRLEQHTGGAF